MSFWPRASAPGSETAHVGGGPGREGDDQQKGEHDHVAELIVLVRVHDLSKGGVTPSIGIQPPNHHYRFTGRA